MSRQLPERPNDGRSPAVCRTAAGWIRPSFSPEWRLYSTPGHTPGHVSLFRGKDGILIVGDAFAGTKQESLLSVLTQEESVKGPPAYFTQDWDSAKQSVQKLWDLKPNLALFSHGNPKEGEDLSERLGYLASHFDEVARPGSKH
jgi:glyoxylase-like metal-dependent hydrolase (beta-lactamase superfamily II)